MDLAARRRMGPRWRDDSREHENPFLLLSTEKGEIYSPLISVKYL